MKKIEAIVKPFKSEAVRDALIEVGVEGMTLSDVKGFGRQKGHSETHRGTEYTVDFMPKIKFEVVIADDRVSRAVDVHLKNAIPTVIPSAVEGSRGATVGLCHGILRLRSAPLRMTAALFISSTNE